MTGDKLEKMTREKLEGILSNETIGKLKPEEIQLISNLLSEEKYRDLFESSTDALYISSREGKIIDFNQAALDLFGYEREDLLKTSVSELYVNLEDRERFIEEIKKKGHVKGMEVQLKKKDGTIVDCLLTSTISEDEKGNLIYQGIIRDITEQIKAQHKLKQSEEKYSLSIDSAPYGILVSGKDGKVLIYNPKLEKITGYPSDDILDLQTFLEKISPDKEYQELFAEENETVITHKDGEQRTLSFATTNLFHGMKISFVKDITEREKAEQLQKALYNISEATHRTTSLDELIGTIDISLSKVVNTDNFYIAFYDKERDELSFPFYKDEKDKGPEEAIPLGNGLTAHVIKNKKSMFLSDNDMNKLEEKKEIELIGAPSKQWLGVPLIIDEEVIGVLALQNYSDKKIYSEKDLELLEFVSNEIAESIQYKKVEEALKRANKTKDLFIGTVLHDIRNPASNIHGILDYFLETGVDLDLLEAAKSSSEELFDVLGYFTVFSQMERGERIKTEEMDMGSLVSNTVNAYDKTLENVHLKLDIQEDLPNVFSHPIIKQVLRNNLTNADKYAPKDSDVIVKLYQKDENHLALEVIDAGKTLSEEDYQAIWEAGVYLEKNSKGRGIGLSNAREIGEALDCEVNVRANPEGGNIFYTLMPIK
ncbi:PAS domain S-box protein [Candidatus Woesearchaeota archaeon]|nr:PAS domain S-box protein [Candidatus Woesearchaeota archaeon]